MARFDLRHDAPKIAADLNQVVVEIRRIVFLIPGSQRTDADAEHVEQCVRAVTARFQERMGLKESHDGSGEHARWLARDEVSARPPSASTDFCVIKVRQVAENAVK
jgi:hypothetical protein